MPTAVLVFLITLFYFLNKEKHELQPNDLAISKSLEASGRIYAYRKDLADTLVRTFGLVLETHRHKCQTKNILMCVLQWILEKYVARFPLPANSALVKEPRFTKSKTCNLTNSRPFLPQIPLLSEPLKHGIRDQGLPLHRNLNSASSCLVGAWRVGWEVRPVRVGGEWDCPSSPCIWCPGSVPSCEERGGEVSLPWVKWSHDNNGTPDATEEEALK